MERDPFSSFNPESTPEKSDKDSKSEKKSEKKKSFIDDIREKRSTEKSEASTARAEKAEKPATKKELAKEYLDHKSEELKEQIENHTSLEQAVEDQADLNLVEAISDKIDHPDKEVEPAVEEAYNELMEALDEDNSPEEQGLENIDEPVELSEQNDDEQEEAIPSPMASPGGTNSSSTVSTRSTGIGSTSSSSGGSTPPPPPTSPPTPPSPPPRRPTPPIPPAHAVPPPPNPNFNAAPATSPEEDRRRVAGKMIVAGAVGYMIGRRGGRKRTEAKLNPEIKKRDETIIDLKKNVEAKEFSIRQAANEKYAQSKQKTPEAMPPSARDVLKMSSEEVSYETPDKPEVNTTPEQTIKTNTPEKPQPEKEPKPFEAQKKPEKDPIIQKHIEQVSTPDLLRVAEKIVVLDTSVKKLYDTNQIDRRGLEEIVKEHLKGHDIGPVLDKRLLGHEAILDRSHEFRHDPTKDDSTSDDSIEAEESKPIIPIMPPKKPQLYETTPPLAYADQNRNQQTNQRDERIESKKKLGSNASTIIAIILAAAAVIFLYSLTR